MALDFYFLRDPPSDPRTKGGRRLAISDVVHERIMAVVLDGGTIRTVPGLDRGFPLLARMRNFYRDVTYKHAEMEALADEAKALQAVVEDQPALHDVLASLVRAARDARNGGFGLLGASD